jgi:hypothetical protein
MRKKIKKCEIVKSDTILNIKVESKYKFSQCLSN